MDLFGAGLAGYGTTQKSVSSGAWRVYVKTANTFPQRLKP
jgi:hypothetical protein